MYIFMAAFHYHENEVHSSTVAYKKILFIVIINIL